MSQATRENSDGKYHQLVLEARWQMQQARNQYWEEMATRGGASDSTQQLLATRAMQYYDVLWEFAEENERIKESWNQSDVRKINEWGTELTEVDQPASGDTAATETRQVPMLTEVPPQTSVHLTKQLDDIAKHLGFSASVDSGRSLGHVGPKPNPGGGGDGVE